MNWNGVHPLYGQGYQNFKQAVLMVINIILTHRAQGIWYNTFKASNLSKLTPYSKGSLSLTLSITVSADILLTLRWRHNVHGVVSNHQPHQCLLNRLFGCRSKKTSKLRVTGLCAGYSPETGEFPAQMASNAENVSIWWRHHVKKSWITLISCLGIFATRRWLNNTLGL